MPIPKNPAVDGCIFESAPSVSKLKPGMRKTGFDPLLAKCVEWGCSFKLARAGEIDDVLLVMLRSNADNASSSGDDGRANFLYKLADVCVREKKAASEEPGQSKPW